MQQLSLLPHITSDYRHVARNEFSHQGLCDDSARNAIENRYTDLFQETDKFNRQLVSFQANKTETLHSWFKYREGFSATLVELLIDELGLQAGETLLDPFAGSCTTLLVAKMFGINAVGVELLPHCHLAWQGKAAVFAYDLAELRHLRRQIEREALPSVADKFPHLAITETAFEPSTEQDLMRYVRWFETLAVSEPTRTLLRLLVMSILEQVSYTRKDGQYLRWDRRAGKMQANNARRIARGNTPVQGIHKGPLPGVKESLLESLDKIIYDIARLQADRPPASHQELLPGNALHLLPTLAAGQIDGVITSPPYANRYDYTRTYALELAFLGVDQGIFDLRQNLLSCTVENRSKEAALAEFYHTIGRDSFFTRVLAAVRKNPTLTEVNIALNKRNMRGEINNRGVLAMIDQYFTELAFVFAELYRLCRPGASVVFVNDNVRYAGEVIPVDTLSTNLAETIGFIPHKIYVLPQRKGNSSQQMGRYGREALRKSITIWRKSES
ncbi:MAG: modification methylase [Caldilineales bacterium]|nr:modification methylase [Caldilineales bacterium]